MFNKLFASALIVISAFSASALADQMGPNGDKFYEEAARFENACLKGECRAPYSKTITYDQKRRKSSLAPNDVSALKAVAFQQAQIWGDTILEGDYYAAGRTRLDEVISFYKGTKLVGYKIKYSEKAWYTGDCNFTGKRETLKDCRVGRIAEVSYVSPDKETYFSDEDHYAEFSQTSLE